MDEVEAFQRWNGTALSLIQLPFEFGRKLLITPKRLPEETKQRATRLVLDHLNEYPNLASAGEAASARPGFGAELPHRWVRQAQVDGERQG